MGVVFFIRKNLAIASYAKALKHRNGKCFWKVIEEGYISRSKTYLCYLFGNVSVVALARDGFKHRAARAIALLKHPGSPKAAKNPANVLNDSCLKYLVRCHERGGKFFSHLA